MKNLRSVNKYFIKYKWRLFAGLIFVSISSLFATQSAVVMRDTIDIVMDSVQAHGGIVAPQKQSHSNHIQEQSITRQLVVAVVQSHILGSGNNVILSIVFLSGMILLMLALLRGLFMFFQRQTLIVMSRHIEYDQKNEIYKHYQELDAGFFKTHFTGDLMNRIAEDVSRVRMYIGPSIMYATGTIALVIFCIWYMLKASPLLTLFVVLPLPVLAITMFYVNKVIFRKSGKIQAQLSQLTTTAQESYSGIRVIKSFVQEKNILRFFNNTSEEYKASAINLSLTEALYFPAINLLIGFSILSTILIGGYLAINGKITTGNIAEFIMYINLLTFSVSSLGMVASYIQRAGASQKRIDEFLQTKPQIQSPPGAVSPVLQGAVDLAHVSFTYQHTGILAIKDLSLHIKPGQKVAILGRTGSGKSTLAHLLLRMYDPGKGEVMLDHVSVKEMQLQVMRRQIGYAPQDAFLFSDTVFNNIKFGRDDATAEEVKEAACLADLDKDINSLQKGYETMIGERGVMLSGGQKQRMILARALLKNSKLLILDDCLSAVDTHTEKIILVNLRQYLHNKTAIITTHRIFTSLSFDQVIVLDNGSIIEQGTHDELMKLNGRYAKLYRYQTQMDSEQNTVSS